VAEQQNNESLIRALRETLNALPSNVVLRQHLAQLLMQMGRFSEAETEYRQALNYAPSDAAVKLGLAQSYYRQNKGSVALVILEELIKENQATAECWMLAARAYHQIGDLQNASRAYHQAITLDPVLADPELAATLPPPPSPEIGVPIKEKAKSSPKEMVFVTVDSNQNNPTMLELERPKVTFRDVGGMEKLKEEIRMKIIYPLTHPELYKAYGKTIGGGILMYGPPGCGKTHLARATAGEVNAKFMAIGLHQVLDMWLGNSEKNLHAIFATARRNAPCVLFFDEVDALGANRSDLRHSAMRQMINQFLSELDGVSDSNEGVLVLAATNAPWYLDPALRRPGRFDRLIFVPPPDAPARTAILQLLLSEKPVERIDYYKLGQESVSFSGADLKGLIDVAVEAKLHEAMRQGRPLPLTTQDMLEALKKIKPSTLEWFSSARNYAIYSNEGGQYDDILEYIKHPERPGLFRNLG